MRIDPNRPRPAAGPPPPRQELERLAEDVCQSGATFWVPRRISWFGRRQADPQEVAHELGRSESRLEVRVPDSPRPRPVLSPGDLEELAYFHGHGPAPDESAASLSLLAGAGFRLVDSEGQELGRYGAYNALTDPAHGGGPVRGALGPVAVPLELPRLGELATFYQQHPLGQLELQGYQFFDAAGQARPAWGSEPPASVGKKAAWMAVDKPESLADRLAEMDRLLAETGDLASARALFELPPDQPVLANQILLESKDLARVLPGALRRLAGVDGLELKAMARKLPADPDTRKLWLGELARRPETAARAREALQCCQGSPEVSLQAWNLFHDQDEPLYPKLLEHVRHATWLKTRDEDERLLSRLVVADLEGTPGGAAVRRWFGDAPNGAAARALLRDPSPDLRALAREVGGSSEVMRRQVEELVADPEPVLELMQSLEPYGAPWVVQAALEHPERRDADSLAGYYRAVERSIEQATWVGSHREGMRKALTEAVMRDFEKLPESRPSVESLRRWHGKEVPLSATRALLAQPSGTDRRRLARESGGDLEARGRQVDELVENPAPVRALMGEMQPYGADWVAEAALQTPRRDDVAQSQAYLQAVRSRLDQATWLSSQARPMREALGRAIEAELERHPESRPTLEKARGWWGGALSYEAAGAVLQSPTATTPGDLRALALAMGGTPDVRQRQVAELVEDPQPVLALMATIGSHGTDWVARAALRQPQRATPEQAASFYQELRAQISQASWLGSHRAPMQAALAQAALTDLGRFPECAVAMERLRAWHGEPVPFAAVSALLDQPRAAAPHELRRLAAQAGGDLLEARHRQVRELVSDPEPVVSLMAELSPHGSEWVARAALEHPRRDSLEELAAFHRAIRDRLDQASWLGQHRPGMQQALARAAVAEVSRLTDCREAVERMRGWYGGEVPYQAAGALLEHGRARQPEELRRLALRAGGDSTALERQVGQLVERPAGVLQLMGEFGDQASWVARAGLEHPRRESPEQVARFHQAVGASLDQATWLGSRREPMQEALGRSLVRELRALPESRSAVSWLEEAGISDWRRAARALTAQPTANTPEERYRLAAQILTPLDEELASKLLSEMASSSATRCSAEVATRLLSAATTPEGRWAVVVAALENPVLDELSGKTLHGRVAELLEPRRHSPEVSRDAQRLARMGSVTEEVLRLARGPERSQTIREDDGRVLVGGAVVKKRDE